LQILFELVYCAGTQKNGSIESFNGKIRDQFLSKEIFYSLKAAENKCFSLPLMPFASRLMDSFLGNLNTKVRKFYYTI